MYGLTFSSETKERVFFLLPGILHSTSKKFSFYTNSRVLFLGLIRFLKTQSIGTHIKILAVAVSSAIATQLLQMYIFG